jgi:putative tryptophan/tyrosine transport system substrate-binding protein
MTEMGRSLLPPVLKLSSLNGEKPIAAPRTWFVRLSRQAQFPLANVLDFDRPAYSSARGEPMRRREFIAWLGGAAAAWPLAARAQATAKLPVIGFLGSGTASSQSELVAAFGQHLRELGWIDGHTVAIDYLYAEGRNDRAAEIAAEFVRRKVDVIVSIGSATTAAAKQATSTIPIVFAVVGDPVGVGFVASLARPAGNLTGLSNEAVDTAAKRLGLLRDLVPNLHRLAIAVNIDNPGPAQEAREVQAAAAKLGVAVDKFEIRRDDDIISMFTALQGRTDAIYVCADGLMNSNRVRINTLALIAKLPTMHGNRELLEGGGLLSYGANIADLCRHAADYVDKILRGAKPADIPVEEPTKFELVINLKAAKALGLNVPYSMQLLADEVIE